MGKIKNLIKPFAKFILRTYHTAISYIVSNKLKPESYEKLIKDITEKGYNDLPYPIPVLPLQPNTINISFIIPVYNCESYIGYCLDTILQQYTKYTYEIICVNDGSKDNSLNIIKEYHAKYGDKLIVIDQPNGGASKARNVGIDNAKGEYLAFIDSDDFVYDNYINLLMDEAKKFNADIVQAGYNKVLANHTIVYSCPRKPMTFSTNEAEKVFKNVSGYLWSGIIRKSLFDNVRFAQGFWYEDMITKNIIARRAKIISIIPDCIYGYTFNPNSLSTQTWDSKKIKCFDQYFIAKKMHDVSKNVLGLQDDPLYFTTLLHEFSCVVIGRIKNQPLENKKKIFLLMADFINSFKNITLINNDYKRVLNSFLTYDFGKWLHISKSKRYK